jgi:hypothetical protein
MVHFFAVVLVGVLIVFSRAGFGAELPFDGASASIAETAAAAE